ncbi:unnamed protein product [marine sediment metagenome]|uniref:Uncharacterized protein n=1 Tax=marine sediment metagenome TaxID=412755 RepID=X1Q3E3_9ZZZZ
MIRFAVLRLGLEATQERLITRKLWGRAPIKDQYGKEWDEATQDLESLIAKCNAIIDRATFGGSLGEEKHKVRTRNVPRRHDQNQNQ